MPHECGSLRDPMGSDGPCCSTWLRVGQGAGLVHGRLTESSLQVHEQKCPCTWQKGWSSPWNHLCWVPAVLRALRFCSSTLGWALPLGGPPGRPGAQVYTRRQGRPPMEARVEWARGSVWQPCGGYPETLRSEQAGTGSGINNKAG